MITAFQSNAFQNNAFQIAATPIIVVDDGHDFAIRRKRWSDETDRKARKKAEVIAAYERIVEGRPDIAREIAAPFIRPSMREAVNPTVNFDRLMSNLDQVDRLWSAYIAMDDEEVMMLL